MGFLVSSGREGCEERLIVGLLRRAYCSERLHRGLLRSVVMRRGLLCSVEACCAASRLVALHRGLMHQGMLLRKKCGDRCCLMGL